MTPKQDKADAFRNAGLTNGGEPGCLCHVVKEAPGRDDLIYRSPYCPVVHDPDALIERPTRTKRVGTY